MAAARYRLTDRYAKALAWFSEPQVASIEALAIRFFRTDIVNKLLYQLFVAGTRSRKRFFIRSKIYVRCRFRA